MTIRVVHDGEQGITVLTCGRRRPGQGVVGHHAPGFGGRTGHPIHSSKRSKDAHRSSRRDGGASAVELAIVLPVLVFLAFGIIDFGRLLTAEIQISQAAREGARLAALGAAPTDVAARASQAAPAPGFGGTPATVPTTTPAMQTCPATASAGQTSTVQVYYVYQGILLPARTITQGASMRCGG